MQALHSTTHVRHLARSLQLGARNLRPLHLVEYGKQFGYELNGGKYSKLQNDFNVMQYFSCFKTFITLIICNFKNVCEKEQKPSRMEIDAAALRFLRWISQDDTMSDQRRRKTMKAVSRKENVIPRNWFARVNQA
jgi:hypothetical protein